MPTKNITDDSFEQDVLNAQGIVVVDYWAEWCGPCKALGPVLEEVAADMDGQVTIGKVNIDENPSHAGQYGIRAIPTLMLFKDGELRATKQGPQPMKSKIMEWINESV